MLDERQKCAHCGEHKLYSEFPKNLHRKRLMLKALEYCRRTRK